MGMTESSGFQPPFAIRYSLFATRPHIPNFCFSTSFTAAGLALPPVAFIT